MAWIGEHPTAGSDCVSRSPQGRALAAAIEPIVGSVYFAEEAHDAFHALGHGPTTGRADDEWGRSHWGTVLMTDYHAYFCGRGALLGRPLGEVIAAAFGVFNPTIAWPPPPNAGPSPSRRRCGTPATGARPRSCIGSWATHLLASTVSTICSSVPAAACSSPGGRVCRCGRPRAPR